MSLGGHWFATPVSECAAAWSRSGPRASRGAGATSVWAGRQRRPGSTTGTVWKLAGHRKLCVLTLIRFRHVLREPQWEERSRAVRWGRSVREPWAQRGAWLATPAPETFVEPGMRERGGGALGTRTRVRSRGPAGAGAGGGRRATYLLSCFICWPWSQVRTRSSHFWGGDESGLGCPSAGGARPLPPTRASPG